MRNIFTIISITIWLLIVIYTNTISIIFFWTICFFINSYIYRNKGITYKNISNFSYLFFSFIGTISYSFYLYSYGETFAPFIDDKLYFKNIQSIWEGDIQKSINYTAFEYFIAISTYPFKLFMDIKQYDLLPINWLLGSIIVAQATKFAWESIPIHREETRYIGAGFILFNYACIDCTIHLYRDPLMCICLLLAFSAIYNNKDKKGIFFSLLTASVRGANGVIALIYYFINKFKGTIFAHKTLFFSIFLLLIASFSYWEGYINYNKLGRISTMSVTERTLSDRIVQFRENEGSGGVKKLQQSNNIALNILAIPAYMISPIQIKEIISNSPIHNEKIYRYRSESIWELIHVLFYGFMFLHLFIGLYYWIKNSDKKNFSILIIFIISLISITYISMQMRHKMAFILLFPFAYNYYILYASKTTRKRINILGTITGISLLLYNLI